jgi:hypothetical protein
METQNSTTEEKERGQLFWLLHNLKVGVGRFIKRHKLGTFGILLALFALRAFYQPYVLLAREKSFLLVLFLLLLVIWVWAGRQRR